MANRNEKKRNFENQFHRSAHKYPNNPFRNLLTASSSFISVSARKKTHKKNICAFEIKEKEEEKRKINHCRDADSSISSQIRRLLIFICSSQTLLQQ